MTEAGEAGGTDVDEQRVAGREEPVAELVEVGVVPPGRSRSPQVRPVDVVDGGGVVPGETVLDLVDRRGSVEAFQVVAQPDVVGDGAEEGQPLIPQAIIGGGAVLEAG